jgi:hypothetical protein
MVLGDVGRAACLALVFASACSVPQEKAPHPTPPTRPSPARPLPAPSAEGTRPPAPPPNEVPPPAPTARTGYDLGGRRLELVDDAAECAVLFGVAGSPSPQRLELSLAPPCYVVTWQNPPPLHGDAQGVSDGVPVGSTGQPKAYRYGNGLTVVMVLGDPIPSSDVARSVGQHCGGNMQAVLLDGKGARVSKKLFEHAQIRCVEWEVEEKDYWIFGHEG